MDRKGRKCTDFCCWASFIACLSLMGFLAYYGTKHGEVKKMFAPINANGMFCGIEPLYNYKFMYFTALEESNDLKVIFNSGVCVKECPTTSGGQFNTNFNC